MKIAFARPSKISSGAYVVFATAGNRLLKTAEKLDVDSGGAISRALKAANFKAGKGDILELFSLGSVSATRIVVTGLGRAVDLDALGAETVGGAIVARLQSSGEKTITVAVDDVPGLKIPGEELGARIAYGALLRSYRFDRYRTREAADKKPSVKTLTMMTTAPAKAEKAYERLAAVAEAVSFSRDLVSEPGNAIYPDSYAKQIRKLEKLGLKVEVLGEKEMRALGMGSLLGVGQGSANESKLVVMQWKGAADAKAAPVALVGKGVTFDTGGISLKPGAGMEDMKFDMAGSAAVVGAMQALALRKAKANVVGVVALVENMPSHKAQRPGDVVSSMSGQTIEVINTDAEGRLILADALWYTQDRFKPKAMVDLATLTGAVIVALGHEHAAVMANNDQLARHLIAAGEAEGELLWRLPLSEAHDKEIDSKIADMKNIAGSRDAGSIIGGQFLQRFVNGVHWAHLDIAGTAWTKKDKPTCPAGATGYGVRLLDRFIADHHEDK